MAPHPAESALAPRSAVPDLLFEDVRDARVEDIRHLLERPEIVDGSVALHRVTVFATYRCNLRCTYCKTIVREAEDLNRLPQRASTFDRSQFTAMLEGHAGTPIEHLHFTGGEASLLRELPDMVRMAKASGVGCVSLTTNGTQAPEVYVRLLEAGIDEIRVSVDDAHTLDGRGEGATKANRALATVRALGELRRAGHEFFLILNTVVELSNRRELPALVRFLLSLGPDDLKLITSVDDKGELASFPEAQAVLAELECILAEHPAERFPLLRRKIQTVFAPDAIGLESERSAHDGTWRCYIPLTERTVDGRFYYPCSVYLREAGEPLGAIDEPQEVQRAKSAAFVARGDCLIDPICSRYCLHCTRDFNTRSNEARFADGSKA